MTTTKEIIASGVVHTVPADLCKALAAAPQALSAWQDITPLARNEWICLVHAPKIIGNFGTRNHQISIGKIIWQHG